MTAQAVASSETKQISKPMRECGTIRTDFMRLARVMLLLQAFRARITDR
jgi:hypothetical protein